MSGENLNNNNNTPDMDDALWDMPTDINNMTYVEGQGYVNNDYYNAWKEHAEGGKAEEEAKKEEELEKEPAPEDKKQLKMSWAMMINYYKQHPDEISDLTEDSERAARAAEGVRNDDRKELDKIVTEYISAGRKKLGKVAVEAATEEAPAEEVAMEGAPAEEAESAENGNLDDVKNFNFLKPHDENGNEIEPSDEAEEQPEDKLDYTVDFESDDDWQEQLDHGKFPRDVAADWIEQINVQRRKASQALGEGKLTQEEFDKWEAYFNDKEEAVREKANAMTSKNQGKQVSREITDKSINTTLRNREEQDADDEPIVISAAEMNAIDAKVVPAEVVNDRQKERRDIAKRVKRLMIRGAAIAGVVVALGTALFALDKGTRVQAGPKENATKTETEMPGAEPIAMENVTVSADGTVQMKAGAADVMDNTVDLSEYKTEHGEIRDLDRTYATSLGDEQISMNTISRNGVFNMSREDTYYQSGKHSEHSFCAPMYEGEHKGVESDKESLHNFNKMFANSHELLSIIDDNLDERRDEHGGLARVNEQSDFYTDNDEAFNEGVKRVSDSLASFADGGRVETKTINAGRKFGSLYEQEIMDSSKTVYSELSADEIEAAADKEVKADSSVVKNEDRHGFMLYDKDGNPLITKEKASEYFGVPVSKIDSVWILEECNNVAILYKAQKKATPKPQQQVVTPQPVVINGVPVNPTPTPTPTPEPTPTPTPTPEGKDPEAIRRNMQPEGTEKVTPEGPGEQSERPQEGVGETPSTEAPEQQEANERAEEEKGDAEEKSGMSDEEASEYFKNFNS